MTTAVQIVEKLIAQKTIEVAISHGYELRVNDGEEIVTPLTQDKNILIKAMFSTDEDYLLFYRDGKRAGYAFFVYGNDGVDVISDYSLSIEAVMKEIDAYVESLGWEV